MKTRRASYPYSMHSCSCIVNMQCLNYRIQWGGGRLYNYPPSLEAKLSILSKQPCVFIDTDLNHNNVVNTNDNYDNAIYIQQLQWLSLSFWKMHLTRNKLLNSTPLFWQQWEFLLKNPRWPHALPGLHAQNKLARGKLLHD
jgi:hypothetical protein